MKTETRTVFKVRTEEELIPLLTEVPIDSPHFHTLLLELAEQKFIRSYDFLLELLIIQQRYVGNLRNLSENTNPDLAAYVPILLTDESLVSEVQTDLVDMFQTQ